MRHVHSDRLERWLGPEYVADVSRSMADWYGKPIPIANVPGRVYAAPGGDFVGHLPGGRFASYRDLLAERTEHIWKRWYKQQFGTLSFGFTGVADFLLAARLRKQELKFKKTKPNIAVAGACMDLWGTGPQPPAGAVGAAAPGGTEHNGLINTGSMYYRSIDGYSNFVAGVKGMYQSATSIGAHNLLLYDRLFSVAKTMNSTATEAVTGILTRYGVGADDTSGTAVGNFLHIWCSTVLPATAHNWTTCLYTDQSGNTGATLPSVTGVSACAATRMDQPVHRWFCPLASGDTGISNLTQMQCSAAVASGAITFVIGHPLAWIPTFLGGGSALTILDGVFASLNLSYVFGDEACLALLLASDRSEAATDLSGSIELVSGLN